MNTTVEVLGFARDPGWLPWAVQYFFLIGISTTAFFLSLPGLVWRRPDWRGVSRHALLVALVCGLVAPVALLADLHQPGRFLNFYLHPNFNSWMAWGSFFIPLYLFGLLLYAWLCLRPLLAELAARPEAGKRLAVMYRKLAYGGHDNTGAIRMAAIVAAVGALLVLLYTGMELMTVQARPLWNSPLLPLLFAVSALAGGIGMTGLFEALSGKFSSAPLLNRWLERSQWAILVLLAAWLISGVTGFSAAAADVLSAVRGSPGWTLTLGWLLGTTLLTLWLSRKRRDSLVFAGLLALHGTWLVRWIVFMGGQSLPKLGATFSTYSMSMTPDSLLGIIGTAGLCLTLYIILTSFIPWDEPVQARGVQS